MKGGEFRKVPQNQKFVDSILVSQLNMYGTGYTLLSCTKFGLVGFYGISTTVDYLMPNPLYTYILIIYDLVKLCFMAHQPL